MSAEQLWVQGMPPILKTICAAVLIVAMPWTATAQQVNTAQPVNGAQQVTGEVWRGFAQKLGSGTEVTVRLQNGQRFAATLIDARTDALVLQPRTRRPVAVQAIGYDAILLLERRDRHGMGAAKAAGIGIAAGAGAFLAILAIFAATVD